MFFGSPIHRRRLSSNCLNPANGIRQLTDIVQINEHCGRGVGRTSEKGLTDFFFRPRLKYHFNVHSERMNVKIGDISKQSGVPASTIRYYVREGLLPVPVKINKKMSHYDDGCVERLKVIQYLQERRYFPLYLIKNILRRMDEGLSLQEAESVESAVFNPAERSAGNLLDRRSMLAETGLTDAEATLAEQIGILIPFTIEGGKSFYNEDDIRFGRDVLKRIIDFGLDLKVLAFYVELGGAIVQREMELRRMIVSDKTARENIRITVELSMVGDFLRDYVMRRLFRNQVQENIRKSLTRQKSGKAGNRKKNPKQEV